MFTSGADLATTHGEHWRHLSERDFYDLSSEFWRQRSDLISPELIAPASYQLVTIGNGQRAVRQEGMIAHPRWCPTVKTKYFIHRSLHSGAFYEEISFVYLTDGPDRLLISEEIATMLATVRFVPPATPHD